MARKAKKHPYVRLAQKQIQKLVKLVIGFLAAIGKPLYLFFNLLARSVVVNQKNIKKITNRSVKKLHKFFKKSRKRGRPKKRKIKTKSINVKLALLRVSLFKLKALYKIKKFFGRRLSYIRNVHIVFRILILLISGLFFFALICFYFFIYRTLPPAHDLTQKELQVSTKIYDRNGNLLYKIYKDQNRTIVPLSQIPIHVRLATLAAEDAEFYDHPGFSLKGITRAIIQDLKTGSLQGGSTITQQLVKNVLLTPEKTFTRKLKEIVLSIQVETNYTKDQILEMYLNQSSFGGTSYGIQEASQEFFGKNVEKLDLAEAAFLAGLTKSPTTYSPYGPTQELGLKRQREVLRLMVINKFITSEQEKSALQQKLIFIARRNTIKAPHFVMYIRQLLVDEYGEDMVEKGGLEVVTSLDLKIQEMAEKVVRDEVDKLKGLNVGNGAALVTNPQTGEILAMVGSTDYFNTLKDGQVNVTLRLRQPGSSIKVVNYAYALSSGTYTPATYINDSPITYRIPGSQPYSPVNYDGQFVGNIPLRGALAQSRNIPAVKVLASYGVDKMIKQGQEMGITSWEDPSKFGLSLTLGGGATTALDLSNVYSTIANSGKRPESMPILQVKDYKGKILQKNVPQTTQVLDERVSFLLTDILKDNYARAPEFGLNSYLVIKDHPEVAVKTGTSNDLRDNWTAGYNQDYLVITWVGNNNNAPMSRIASGVTGASPIWNKIMSALLNGQPSIDWRVPSGVVKINCPGGRSEWFMEDTILPNFCNPTPSPIPQQTNPPKDQILEGTSTRRRFR